MAQNKKHITPENITEWLSSTGFLFPRNEVELERFEKLYCEEDFGLTGTEIDPDKIISGDFKKGKSSKMHADIKKEEINPYRIAARNGNDLPKHILDKIKRNQSKPNNDSASQEDTNK
ncbi:hypothetical protein [uncultured Imperialibacter sp.]|uniref:hypothetical protein n=1 Tax=uncultured Imperialibacter sp. TaxID=1672639 RepID=UPI0030DC3E38|tara:strand:+ start:12906 stop:13259 length:354 start_codon:yes stop_codon:yes gene_type:complete